MAAGCATHAEFVHPDLASFDLQRIGVYDVENSTVYELRSVSFGGVFQRSVFGVPEYDLHSLLQGAMEEALLKKSYETISLGPAPPGTVLAAGEGASSPDGSGGDEPSSRIDKAANAARSIGKGHDAELHCTVVYWKAESGANPEMDLRYRIELNSAADRQRLYAGTFRSVMRVDPRSRTQPRLDTVIRASALRAFADLPAATVSEGK